MCQKTQMEQLLRKMVSAYKVVYGEDIVDIFLYGSYARGDYNDQSDIDIAAIVNGNRADLQEKLKQVWETAADLGVDYDAVVSPIVIPYDEFLKYKANLPYYKNIAEEGKKIG